MTVQIGENFQGPITGGTYLDMVLSGHAPEHVLLPHEQAAVHGEHERKVTSFQRIIEAKISVSGGDDWHDGAFRATDNEARILTESMAKIAPFLGATVVEYPDTNERRVALGSRVVVRQGRATFPIDIVGFRVAYPDDVIDEVTGEEVMAASPDSPIGTAILGRQVGDEIAYNNGSRILHGEIGSLSQVAVREYFQDATRLNLNTND